MYLRSEFRVAISVNDFRIKRMFSSFLPPVVCRSAHVLFTLFMFVGVRMSYLRYLCLFVYSGVQHIVCCAFILSSSCVLYVDSFSGLSIFDQPFGFLYDVFLTNCCQQYGF